MYEGEAHTIHIFVIRHSGVFLVSMLPSSGALQVKALQFCVFWIYTVLYNVTTTTFHFSPCLSLSISVFCCVSDKGMAHQGGSLLPASFRLTCTNWWDMLVFVAQTICMRQLRSTACHLPPVFNNNPSQPCSKTTYTMCWFFDWWLRRGCYETCMLQESCHLSACHATCMV